LYHAHAHPPHAVHHHHCAPSTMTCTHAGKAARLKGFEDIKALLLEGEAFSVENDLMTPSFKLKRAPLQKRYQVRCQLLAALPCADA
jgi:long-subunit acyl-CoA synthetase (AMP-forming)